MTHSTQTPPSPAPRIGRMRHELKRRELTVAKCEHITPSMLRIWLSGDDLSDFTSLAPDDHVKVIVTDANGEEQRRDYTPRLFDRERRELVIDFVVHDAGPATLWALQAKPGDGLKVGGPRGSRVIEGVSNWLLIGDETALPAIGRRIEELPAGSMVTSLVAVPGATDEQVFHGNASRTPLWVHRPSAAATDPEPLLARLRELRLEPETFVWVAAEASVVRAIRAHLLEERGLDPVWFKGSGYWVEGKADTTENFD